MCGNVETHARSVQICAEGLPLRRLHHNDAAENADRGNEEKRETDAQVQVCNAASNRDPPRRSPAYRS